ncbi:DUF636 domain protein [Apiospora sp. TS-2023a]|uniref:DUF636 domain protein n=1 Tax=Apiospora saccharicola TaxID=335842 RepID=A0ABR1V1I4_9PEZI
MSLSGSCLCGAIKYESSKEPQVKALCHCLDCQKWTGGAFTSNAVVPADGFKVVKGEPKTYDVTGDSGKNNRHFFCGTCGSGLYTKLDVMPDVVIIKAGGLDNGKAALDGKVDVEFYCKDRVSYLSDQSGAKQMPAFG